MGLIQTDAVRFPLEEVSVARMVFTEAEAVVGSTTGLMAARATTGPCHATLVAASAETDTLTINFVATQTDTPVGKISFVLDANTSNELAVSAVDATGVITIKLASSTAASNTAALIQAAIRAVTPSGEGGVEGIVNGISVAAVVCVAGGDWDSAAVAESTTTDMTDVQCVGGGGETIIPDETVLFNQPPCARTITATAVGTDDIGAVSVIVYGTNINDEVISETLPVFVVNTAGTKTGTKAFKTITSVFLPSHDGTDATVSLGYSEALGVPFMFSKKPYLRATLDGVIEANAPTQVTDSDEIEKNTVDINSTLNGKEVCLYYYLPEA